MFSGSENERGRIKKERGPTVCVCSSERRSCSDCIVVQMHKRMNETEEKNTMDKGVIKSGICNVKYG